MSEDTVFIRATSWWPDATSSWRVGLDNDPVVLAHRLEQVRILARGQ